MKKLRTFIFWCHLASGVLAGIIIFIMSATGVILAFEEQIIALAERNVQRVTPPSDGSNRLTLKELLEDVRATRPGEEPESIILNRDPQASLEVSFGRDNMVYVNPYTGQILGGPSRMDEWMHTVRSWHRWLGSRDHGRPITGICNLLFLFLAVSGFYLWWPRQWLLKAFKPLLVFNSKARGKARDWNWHHVIGFWSAPFLIIITLSGAVISYGWANDLLYRLAGSEPPPPRGARGNEQRTTSDEKEEPSMIDVDAIVRQAHQQSADWTSLRLRLPQGNSPTMDVTIEERDPFYPAPRSTLTVDTKTGEPVEWKSYKDVTRGRKWRTWARYLHTGQAAGMVGQVIGVFACIGGCVLVWTGWSLTWHRFFRKNSKKY